MSDVRRYDLSEEPDPDLGDLTMDERPDGSYVSWSDYKALESRLHLLSEENAALIEQLKARANADPGYGVQRQQIAELESRLSSALGLLRQVADSGVSFEDERVSYAEVQLDTDLLKSIRGMIVEKPARNSDACPFCGRTDAHSHTSGPFGMS